MMNAATVALDQYAATVALNNEEIGKDLQRISNIKPVVNKLTGK